MNEASMSGLIALPRLAALGLATLLLAGCGDVRGTVTGQVTLDGKPLASEQNVSAAIQFHPVGNSGRPATSSLDGKGSYSLAAGSQSSVEPGKYVVTVTATQIIPSASGGAPSGRPITPRRYADPRQSEWQVEVKPGNNEFNFELKSDG